MESKIKVWGVRSGMIGDMIMALPILNYIELVYPNSYKYWVIGQRFAQSAPLFINHPLIDKIHVLKSPEKLQHRDDLNEVAKCNIFINVTPEHPDGMPGIDCFWWNHYILCEETFRMAGLKVEEFRKMPEELRKPKLEKWFMSEKRPNSIGLWPFAAYGKEPTRSPSKDWWNTIFPMLMDLDKKIYIFGHPNDPILYDNNNNLPDWIEDVRHLSFFDQIKLSLEMDVCVNTDSGSGWVLGAYGQKQISLITNHAPKHTENLLSFAPENWANKNINVFAEGGCDNIKHENVIDAIKKLI